MKIVVNSVKEGALIGRKLDSHGHGSITKAAPEDGVLLCRGGGDAVYVRFSDMDKWMKLRGSDFSDTVDSWREDDEASPE